MGQNFRDKNYYEILEVPTNASPEEVYQGYMRAKNAYSQDSLALYSLMSEEECNKIVEMIDEAYSVLREADKRRQYDQARGINSDQPYHSGEPSSENPEGFFPPPKSDKKPETGKEKKGNMTKIVAKQRFSLDYEVDEEFEKEIEQTTEFTGSFLQRIREYKKVDLPRLAEMTKVSKNYLRYIEEEDFKNLPARVYTRGFVYQYAKCLKLNPDMVATSYMERLTNLQNDSE